MGLTQQEIQENKKIYKKTKKKTKNNSENGNWNISINNYFKCKWIKHSNQKTQAG